MSKRPKWRDYEMMSDEKLRLWLDDCDEWITADDLKPDAIKFLQARLKRACTELRERLDT